jgi:hypothetical protein
MTDAELEKPINAALGDTRFAATIREQLRDAVAAVIGDGATEVEIQAGRNAADQLARFLVARRDVLSAGGQRHPDIRSRPQRLAVDEDAERRAAAFRAMTGVRV